MSLFPYFVNILALAVILAILALSFDFAMGSAGLVNLGHVAIAGIGAYTSALLTTRLDLPFVVGLIAACVAAGGVGFVLSLPARKVRGDYYALLMLVFAFIFVSVALNWTDLTRGALGIAGIPRPIILKDPFLYLVFLLLSVLGCYLLFERIARSPFGRVQGAVRDDEIAAAALGKRVARVKVITLTISAAIAGFGGALLAHHVQFIDPGSFSLSFLVTLLAATIIGGVASRKGSLIGAVLIFVVLEPLRFFGFPAEMIGVIREGLFALFLLAVIIIRPRGILGTIDL